MKMTIIYTIALFLGTWAYSFASLGDENSTIRELDRFNMEISYIGSVSGKCTPEAIKHFGSQANCEAFLQTVDVQKQKRAPSSQIIEKDVAEVRFAL